MKKAGVQVGIMNLAPVLGANPSQSKKLSAEMGSPRGFGRGSVAKKGVYNGMGLETP